MLTLPRQIFQYLDTLAECLRSRSCQPLHSRVSLASRPLPNGLDQPSPPPTPPIPLPLRPISCLLLSLRFGVYTQQYIDPHMRNNPNKNIRGALLGGGACYDRGTYKNSTFWLKILRMVGLLTLTRNRRSSVMVLQYFSFYTYIGHGICSSGLEMAPGFKN